ncbi:MAG: dienelactone hydrolase family protein [Pseudomonadota bacterium]|nr:dienelactone hydrolase family protein [Pseudomonadota bacterium]
MRAAFHALNSATRFFVGVAFIAVVILAEPIPASAADAPAGGTAIGVPSPDADGKTTVLAGMLWWPEGTPRAGIVFANGSGGWRDAREGYYGRMLSAVGYAVLAVDSFGARGIADTVADQSSISVVQMARDAFAARRLLIARGIVADRTAIMGGSRGGTIALLAADRTFLPAETERFQAAIAFYPGCNLRVRAPKPASALFMLEGERDNYTGVKPCQDIAKDYEKAGGKVVLKIYPDSAHDFDGDPAHSRMFRDFMAETFIDCVGSIEDDGTIVYEGRRFDGDRGFADLVAYFRQQPCAGHGATMWTNRKQKAIAGHDVVEFLDATFPR